MKKQFHIFFFFISLATAFSAPGLWAQTACDKALIAAENLYQSGQLYDIPQKLLPCVENGFNYQEKQSAYRLLALTYLNINQEEKAKEAFHRLLKLNPDYVVTKEKDPVELFNLFQQFNVRPVFYTGLRLGLTATMPLVLNSRSSSSSMEGSGTDKFYSPYYGFTAAADFALPLRKNLLLEFSPAYSRNSYLFESQFITDGFSETPEIIQVQEVSGRETYQHILLPLTLNVRLPSKVNKLYYNIGMGAGASFLLSSSYHNVNRENRRIFTEEISIEKIKTTDFRRRANLSAHLELGLEYKYLGYFWGARAGVSSTLLNVTRYRNQEEMFFNTMASTFGWLDDDFVLGNTYFAFFVRKPMYKFL